MHVLSWSEQNTKKQTRRLNHSRKIPRKPYTYMNEGVRKGLFKESQRVMIRIWRRSHYDKKNTHSMRLEDTNQTSLSIYYSRKGKGKNKNKEGSGEKKQFQGKQTRKLEKGKALRYVRYQNMKKQNLFRGNENPPRKYGKMQLTKAPNPHPNFRLKNKQSRLAKHSIVAWS